MRKKIKKFLKKLICPFLLDNESYIDQIKYDKINEISKAENNKKPSRTDIINYLIRFIDAKNYLEIGVRNPDDNFNKIKCLDKFSVDPGVEFKSNPVDFRLTSDVFFEYYNENKLSFSKDYKFDIIFIDGLHLAEQVNRDIKNSLNILSENGLIVLHDCNPPTNYHAREDYSDKMTPAKGYWNGTTWKAFYANRFNEKNYSITFDSDWGVGVISKQKIKGFNNLTLPMDNPFYEFYLFAENKNTHLNLQDFMVWSSQISENQID